MIKKSKQDGIKCLILMPFYKKKNTGKTQLVLCSSKMKYGLLMRNAIFLGYKKTTKIIRPVKTTRVLFSPSLPYVQYFILIFLSNPLVSLWEERGILLRNITQHVFMAVIGFNSEQTQN